MDGAVSGTDREARNRAALGTAHLMPDLGRRTARGGLLALGAQCARIVVSLASIAVMARLLAPEDFGLVAMAATVTAFAMLFQDLGLSAATVQPEHIDQNTVSALFFINNGVGIGLFAITAAAAPVAALLFDDPRVQPLTLAMALTIPLAALGAQHKALLQRGMRWGALHGIGVASQLLGAVLAIALLLTTAIGYWALAVQALAAAALQTAMLWVASGWLPSRVRDWRAARPALGFGLYLTAFGVVNYLHRYADNILIGWRLGAADLGHYSRAYTLMSLPLQVVNGPAGTAVIAALSRLQSRKADWARMYTDALGVLTFISAPVAGALVFAADEVILLMLGEAFAPATDIFRALALSIFAQPIMSSTGWLWISVGDTRRMFHWAMMAVPVLVLSMAIGLQWGAVGVALAYSVTFTALTPLCTAFAARRLPLRTGDVYAAVSWPLLSALVALGACLAVPLPATGAAPALAAKLTLYAAAYVAAAGALGLLFARQRRRLWHAGKVFLGGGRAEGATG
jgi:PST family polysaccharide transporter